MGLTGSFVSRSSSCFQSETHKSNYPNKEAIQQPHGVNNEGLLPSRENDIAGICFVWSQPSSSASPTAYRNEYVLEAAYVLQITPFAKLQPDLQFVWNPANNPNADHALVFQLQLNVAW
jgi:hypothetical protein